MDEELKEALLDTLNDARSAAEQGKDFVLEQAPLVVQEYVRYTFVWSLACCIALIIAMVATIMLWRWVVRMSGDMPNYDKVLIRIVGGFGFSCALGLMVCGLCHYSSMALKASIAPRVLIIEKAADLIR